MRSRREWSWGPVEINAPNPSFGKFEATHGNWQDDLRIASQVSDVAVQGYPLLNSSSLADGQGHSQNGIRTKFSYNGTELN